jgi:hydrogenase maturation protease
MKKAPTPRVLVVGLGNPDRGDDGVGPIVVEKLVGLLPTDVAVAPPGADVLTLMMEWADFDAVVFVDAAAPLTTPGGIHCFNPANTELLQYRRAASSHGLGLAEAIGLSRVLRQAPRNIIVFAVEGASFAAGASMAPEVAAAAAEVADRVVAEVARLRQSSNELTADA